MSAADSPLPLDAVGGLAAAAACVGVGLATEVVLWAWAYRQPGYRSLRVRQGCGRGQREGAAGGRAW